FFSSRRRHTRSKRDWSSDVCSSDLKPTQHSVQELRRIGVQPDVIVARSKVPLKQEPRKKIALFCNVEESAVFTSQDIASIYGSRSEEHTSELQSRFDLVCRLLLEKK